MVLAATTAMNAGGGALEQERSRLASRRKRRRSGWRAYDARWPSARAPSARAWAIVSCCAPLALRYADWLLSADV